MNGSNFKTPDSKDESVADVVNPIPFLKYLERISGSLWGLISNVSNLVSVGCYGLTLTPLGVAQQSKRK